MEKLVPHFNSIPSNAVSVVKKKTNEFSSGSFGVHLDELCTRDGQGVPIVVTQMCSFLCSSGGLLVEGVFRVNGNSRVVENLRNAADSSTSEEGTNLFLTHLQRYGDIHSVASLLKLFLRELPIGLVPPSHTRALLEVTWFDKLKLIIVLVEALFALNPVFKYR